MIYFIALAIGILLIFYLLMPQSKKHHEYLKGSNFSSSDLSNNEDKQAVKLESLSDETLKQALLRFFNNTYQQIDSLANIKIPVYCAFLIVLGIYINKSFLQANPIIIVTITEIIGLIFGVVWLRKREKNRFEESFPDALNMMSSAVSAGEGIMQAVVFVGRSLDGKVGKEFKRMGEQLQLGESPDTVFRKSCERFPYPSFQFFIITLRTSMQRGGQLKEVMKRLNRLMFGARAIEKKKLALTSEARASAKIVAAIPFIFLFMLQYLSPENYEFVMFNPAGRPILYYVLISESIGILIIWLLMRGVRA
ncbi:MULTISPECIES: type II secretion system F family protein [Aliivibrio]|uniref:type II secretion system F family protein n=1 Tax=Aliivibrio TaxID=511678 RepID=UPI00031658A8|nr:MULTISPECIES: type II secretion system F family protein [Aliivibrio]MBD1570418.1 pilus assembly protein TadB [Aliivibrio sp. S10_S31]MUH98718.1 pilus assembly protein TadB [Aliivibrio fischeri]MUI62302.1 pilus assembly protein TadB [Aliivibrio fischeri]MUJ25697.1 pilus assembly protein TadB [Aliivibrio fischeri]MUK28030.1 pilus assembly protein TadB [Aliivibrio fischeri]